jgi:XTP/dITP diphosphohydrolase
VSPASTPVVALASRNPGKLREIRSIVDAAGLDVRIASADEFPGWVAPPEDAPDYFGNALLKARSLAEFAGVAALADDSGIEVDALGGEPGPRSARFAGEGASDEENLSKLVGLIHDVHPESRTARYRCVAVLVTPDGSEASAEGVVEGILHTVPRGTGGFGYDPIFVPLSDHRTMSELPPEEKDAISHRGRAFRGLVGAIARFASRAAG